MPNILPPWITSGLQRSLQDSDYHYKTKFKTGFNTFESKGLVSIVVKEEFLQLYSENTFDDVVIVEEIQLQKNTLAPISRLVKQGGVEISVLYKDDVLEADYVVRSELQKCVLSLSEPLVTDGIALPFWLSCLPLQIGQTAVYERFNTLLKVIEKVKIEVSEGEVVQYRDQKLKTLELKISPLSGSKSLMRFLISDDERRLVLYEQELLGLDHNGEIERWLI